MQSREAKILRIALLSSSMSSIDTFAAFKLAAPIMPSIGILHIAANLEKNDYKDIFIYDADLMNDSSNSIGIVEWLKSIKPDVIGITVYSNHVPKTKIILEIIREEFQNVPIIGGGPHCTIMHKKTFDELALDYICVGEGEHTMVEFLDYLSGLRPVESIKGIAFKKEGKIIFNGERPLEKNIYKFPYPAYHLIEEHIPMIRPQLMGYKRKPLLLLISSRGCPYLCGFCSDHILWKRKFRAHSPEYLVKMIEYFIQKYGIREITFFDDSFLLSKKRVEKFCYLLIEKKISIYWSANINLAHVSKDIVIKMKKAGCWYVSTGIESGNDEILKFIGKPLTLELARDNLNILAKVGILCRGYFIIGLLKDTRKTIQDTIEFILNNPLFLVHICIYSIYPGALWNDKNEDYGTVYNDKIYQMKGAHSGDVNALSFVGKGLTSGYLIKKQSEGYRRFFLRFSQILIILKSVSTKHDVEKILKFFFAGLLFLYKSSRLKIFKSN